MTPEKIKNIIAPCGLCCETCFAHVEGDIRHLAVKLKEKLGNFHINAKRFETLLGDPVFKKYGQFKAMLDYFSSEHCAGCRKEQCKIFPDCGVRPCTQQKNLDFCWQCDEFPCDKTQFDPVLVKGWILMNEKIRDIGIEAYAKKARTRLRY